MRLHIAWVLLAGAILSSPATEKADDSPAKSQPPAAPASIYSRDDIRQLMRKVDDWQLANRTKDVAENNWLRATWYTGVMAAYKATGERNFLQQTLDWPDRSIITWLRHSALWQSR